MFFLSCLNGCLWTSQYEPNLFFVHRKEKNMHQEDMMFDLKKGSKCNYREVRKFKFFKEDNFEKLVEVMNKFIEGKNAKIVNYTIDGHLNYAKCLLLYSVTIKSKS